MKIQESILYKKNKIDYTVNIDDDLFYISIPNILLDLPGLEDILKNKYCINILKSWLCYDKKLKIFLRFLIGVRQGVEKDECDEKPHLLYFNLFLHKDGFVLFQENENDIVLNISKFNHLYKNGVFEHPTRSFVVYEDRRNVTVAIAIDRFSDLLDNESVQAFSEAYVNTIKISANF